MSIILRGMRNVLRNPIRLILVVVLLGASLMFVAAMTSLNNSAQQEIASVHSQVGTAITIDYAVNSLQGSTGIHGTTLSDDIHNNTNTGSTSGRSLSGGPGSTRTVTPIPNTTVTTISKIAGISNVESMTRQIDGVNELKTGSIAIPTSKQSSTPLSAAVYGISNGAAHYILGAGSTPKVVAGGNFLTNGSNSDVAMMSQRLATLNNLTVGSTFQIKGKTFTLVGIYTMGLTGTDDEIWGNTVVIPLTVAESLYSFNGVGFITAYAATYDQVTAVTARLKAALGPQYTIQDSNQPYQNTFSALGTAQNSIYLALIVSVAVAIVIIIFTIFIVVRERTAEIGILKAIGASHWQVIRQFWGEVLAISGLGAIIGMALLAILGPIISRKFNVNMPSATTLPSGGGDVASHFSFTSSSAVSNVHIASATLNLETVLIIVGSGIVLAIMTSIIPALYVSRIKPAIVLRKEGN